MAGLAAGDFRHLAFGVAQFGDDAGGALGQRLTRGGERQAAPGAAVDGVADDTLHLGQEAGGSGLGYAKARGSEAELPGLQQRGEQAQVAELEPAAEEVGLGHLAKML